jgi:D-alanyl-D-alanine carboxypeptidase-like protein
VSLLTLDQKQRLFARMVGDLIQWAYAHGYEITFGETKRSDEQAEINALGAKGRERLADYIAGLFPSLAAKIRNNTGSGIRNSLHEIGLAIDLNLFRDGKYLDKTEDHRRLGERWEAMGGAWGGRFGDGNHYSLEHEGRK